MSAPPPEESGLIYWWEDRRFIAALIFISIVPLLYPQVPPLVDLFGHIGRYRVELDLPNSPFLQREYTYQWQLMGNLGLDLLIVPMAKLFGLELGVKLLVMAIPALTVAGFLWVASEVHHRLPPTALFALPFAYGHPFLFGFVNFSLSMALAFCAFGLWLRMGRLGATRLRLVLFVPISLVLWLVHAFGWGLMGLLAFSAETVRQYDRGRGWLKSVLFGALSASIMAGPILLTLYWQHDATTSLARDWFNWTLKGRWVTMALRDRWEVFDKGSVFLVALLLAVVIAYRRLTCSRNLLFSALVLSAVYVFLPRIMFGSAYADMRLVPFILAVILLSIRFKSATYLPVARVLAIAGLGFFLIRTAGTTASLGVAAIDQHEKLVAIDHVPRGARVLILSGQSCGRGWALERDDHLGGMVIARREGFSNDQWRMEDAKLLGVRDPQRLGWFAYDPSQQVRPNGCGTWEHWSIDRSLASFPRGQFDYIWLINPPPYSPALVADFTVVWRGGASILYRIPS